MNGISIAIMTDVHANLPALQAVLGEVDRIGCDLIYHTDDLDAYFSFIPADIVFYGHIHKPSRVNGEKEYVNPGSVGCTKDSMSRFCILRIRNGSYKLESHETKYNKSVVFRELEHRKVPDRQFIARTFYGYS